MTTFRESHRVASVVVASQAGNVLGLAGPYYLAEPWFQEIGDLVVQLDADLGTSAMIVRLLQVDDANMPELRVLYLAQVESAFDQSSIGPWDGRLEDDPRRLPYAELGGPGEELDWATAVLDAHGHGPVVTKKQMRTWNLSSIWRLTTSHDTFWLKSVPPFFAHEPDVIRLLEGERAPRLLASEGGRMLLHHIPGEDCYDADLNQMLHMVEQLVDLQWCWRDRLDELMAIGVPDSRDAVLIDKLPRVAALHVEQLDDNQQRVVHDFLDTLPERFTKIHECGIPVSLVHGDFHPGNWRGTGLDLTILDWGDCSIGHPLLDLPGLVDRTGQHEAVVLDHWRRAWQMRLPDADVTRAIDLIRPLAYARMALVFQDFLDHIERSERIYHDSDPVFFLRKVATIVAGSTPL